MDIKFDTQTSPNMQLELAVTLNKIESVEKMLAAPLSPESDSWYRNRLGELAAYRDQLNAELVNRGEGDLTRVS